MKVEYEEFNILSLRCVHLFLTTHFMSDSYCKKVFQPRQHVRAYVVGLPNHGFFNAVHSRSSSFLILPCHSIAICDETFFSGIISKIVNYLFLCIQAADACGPELSALKRSIRKLENKLFIGAWQVQHLQIHKYFRPIQPGPDSAPSPVADVKTNSNWTRDNSNMTLVTQLPPAGNLIVYDKGKKSCDRQC